MKAYLITTYRKGYLLRNVVFAESKAHAHERMKLYADERILSIVLDSEEVAA